MRKMRLLLMVAVWAALSVTNVHARAVGDVFMSGNYRCLITSLDEGNYTVELRSFTAAEIKNGVFTIPQTVKDSTTTTFKVASVYFYSDVAANVKQSVVTMTFPEGFEKLRFNSVTTFNNMTTVNLPASLQDFEPGGIYSNQKLTTINVASANPYYKSVGGSLYSKDGTILYYYPMGKTATSFTTPSSVTTLVKIAIQNNNLTSISIGENVINVDDNAFYSTELTRFTVAAANPAFSAVNNMLCSKDGSTLVKVPQSISGSMTLPAGIKTLNSYSFNGSKITKLYLTGVETIKHEAFYSSAIREITLYPSLKNVEEGISSNWLLEKITISGTNDYFSLDGSGALYNKDYSVLLVGLQTTTNYTTHPNTKIIGGWAFNRNHSLSSLFISNNVEEIHSYAFLSSPGYSKLQSVAFEEPSKLKSIGSLAFEYAAITTLTLPASVETIDYGAFAACPNLQKVEFKSGSKIAKINERAFYGNSKLTTFEFLSHTAPSLTIGKGALQNCTKLVGASAADGFVFPMVVDSIGESAFNGCSALQKVTFQKTSTKKPSLKYIGFAAFQNAGLNDIAIPDSVTFIGNEAFNSCQKLTEVRIPAATTHVGPQAFLFCGKLTDILVDKNNANYSSCDGMLASKDKKTLYCFPAGKAATYYTMLSPSFETINDSAFYYCRDLKSVTIPKKVTKIGAHAFAICNNLERINFLADNPITDVHEEAFVDMNKNSLLKNVNIYVRNGHGNTYRNSPFWGTGKSKSINEAYVVSDSENGRVEYFPMSPTDASIVSVGANMSTSELVTFVVPEKVPGHEELSVKLIGDYAFEGSQTAIDEVVVPSNIQLNYIGARAFVKGNTSPAIKSVFLVNAMPAELATSAFGLHDPGVTGNYDEVTDGQTIYVKKSAEAAYKAAWPTMESQIDYKISLPTPIANTYGTFCREFDVDLADYFATNGTGRVWAFTSSDGKLFEGTGNGNVEGTYYLKMHSINENGEGDGTYIPAGTGVLLKAADGDGKTKSDYHYTIGEKDINTPVSSKLIGVTRKIAEITDNIPNSKLYAMQGGVFKPLSGQTIWLPAHKAYLKIDNVPAGAKLMFYFNDSELPDDIITAVDGSQLAVDGSASGDIYDLQGRKVTSPTKGIYVKNGKKVIIK